MRIRKSPRIKRNGRIVFANPLTRKLTCRRRIWQSSYGIRSLAERSIPQHYLRKGDATCKHAADRYIRCIEIPNVKALQACASIERMLHARKQRSAEARQIK